MTSSGEAARRPRSSSRSKRELHDRLLRTAAEFENFKKRSKSEIDDAATRGREQLLKEILPALDNLERALKHAPDERSAGRRRAA